MSTKQWFPFHNLLMNSCLSMIGLFVTHQRLLFYYIVILFSHALFKNKLFDFNFNSLKSILFQACAGHELLVKMSSLRRLFCWVKKKCKLKVFVLGKTSNTKSPEFSGIFPTLVNPPHPGIRENQMISYLSFWQP